MTVLKGELHGLFSRRFVEFIVESDAARRYLRWCWDTGHPSEHYWNTLNYNVHLQAPGGYRGEICFARCYTVGSGEPLVPKPSCLSPPLSDAIFTYPPILQHERGKFGGCGLERFSDRVVFAKISDSQLIEIVSQILSSQKVFQFAFLAGDLESAELYSTQPVARVKHWQDVNYVPRECQGKLVRGICVFGVGDASWLATRREVIANKFHLTFEHFALDCMEERHRNRTVNYVGSVSPDFDTEFYRSVPTVRHSRKDGL